MALLQQQLLSSIQLLHIHTVPETELLLCINFKGPQITIELTNHSLAGHSAFLKGGF